MVRAKGTTFCPSIWPPPSKQGALKGEKGGNGVDITPDKTLVALNKHPGQCL